MVVDERAAVRFDEVAQFDHVAAEFRRHRGRLSVDWTPHHADETDAHIGVARGRKKQRQHGRVHVTRKVGVACVGGVQVGLGHRTKSVECERLVHAVEQDLAAGSVNPARAGHALSDGSIHARAAFGRYAASSDSMHPGPRPSGAPRDDGIQFGLDVACDLVEIEPVRSVEPKHDVREIGVAEEDEHPLGAHGTRHNVVLEREIPIGRAGGVHEDRRHGRARQRAEVVFIDAPAHRVAQNHDAGPDELQFPDLLVNEGVTRTQRLENRQIAGPLVGDVRAPDTEDDWPHERHREYDQQDGEASSGLPGQVR